MENNTGDLDKKKIIHERNELNLFTLCINELNSNLKNILLKNNEKEEDIESLVNHITNLKVKKKRKNKNKYRK